MHHLSACMQVDRDLRVMLVKPDAPAPKTIDVTVWQRAIPQFNIHHLEDVQVKFTVTFLWNHCFGYQNGPYTGLSSLRGAIAVRKKWLVPNSIVVTSRTSYIKRHYNGNSLSYFSCVLPFLCSFCVRDIVHNSSARQTRFRIAQDQTGWWQLIDWLIGTCARANAR